MISIAIMASAEKRRTWLERQLRGDPSLKVISSVSTFPLLRSLLDETPSDVVIVDGTGLDSLTARDWLVEFLDEVPLVLISAGPDGWTFNHLVQTERGAILNHDASTEQIVYAVRAANAGLLVFDSSLIPRPDPGEDLMAELTPREIQVLRLLAEGLVNREIADRLNISEHTIKFHIGSILGKLQASSRTEAVTRGLRSGLIEL
jgi:DNA-binding NarL/FixJ family response regulator